MTHVELQRELDVVCRQYRVTRKEIEYGRRSASRPRESRFIQMARGVFIVRCSRSGATRKQLADVCGLSTRAIGYWRAEMIRRGIVAAEPGRIVGRRYTRRAA